MGRDKRIRSLILALLLIIMIFLILGIELNQQREIKSKTIRIGIPYNSYIQDLDINYYKKWLEKQTGLTIEFVTFPNTFTKEYLDIMFLSNDVMVDGFFSFPNDEIKNGNDILEEYGEKGYIIPLNEYMEQSSFIQQMFLNYKDYNLKKVMTANDGNIYYMPGLDHSFHKEYDQIMWINKSWLKTLKLELPQNTKEFEDVLKAFQTQDPNENGIADEVPLVGSMDTFSLQVFHYLINGFTYCDPKNSYMYVEKGRVKFAPITNQWREAMKYLYDLQEEKLLSPMQFTLNKQQLVQLVNDNRNLVGAFTSSSITEVVLQSSPEIISNYICLKPINGPKGIQNATINTTLPKPNGVITSACAYPEEVFGLYELMLSKNAFLIGRFGEENVDWKYAKNGDIDTKGAPATIEIINYLQDKVQNKTLLETGPFLSYSKYSDGVTWNGFEADKEYMNARAYDMYSNYAPSEYVGTILPIENNKKELVKLREEIDEFTRKMLLEFIKGESNPYEDNIWEETIIRYENLQIYRYIELVQESYDSLK